MDRLTKSVHFLAMKMRTGLGILAKKYVAKIVRLHGAPVSIITDRDPRFVYHFWECMQEALSTKLSFNTTYHPQTNGQTEHTNQTSEDLLRSCVLDYKKDWEDCLPLAI